MFSRLRNGTRGIIVALLVLFVFRAVAAPMLCADHGDADTTRTSMHASAAAHRPHDTPNAVAAERHDVVGTHEEPAADAAGHHDDASSCDDDPMAPAGAGSAQAKPLPALDGSYAAFDSNSLRHPRSRLPDHRLIPVASRPPYPEASPLAMAPRLRI